MKRTPKLGLASVAFAAATVVVAGAGAHGRDGDALVAKPAPFTVTSTLEGKKLLPRRIRWVASASLPAAQIREVEFIIDGGPPRWIEKLPPYTYGEDENGRHQNYLVTSWLTPGRHRFVVRATATDGRRAEQTVLARVLPAAAPPAALAGTWKRTIEDTSAAPRVGSPGNPYTHTPPGTYTLVIDKRWIQARFPGRYVLPASEDSGEGWILDSDYTAGATSLLARGSVVFRPFNDEAEGGQWCWEDGPASNYAWSVSADTLTLRPMHGADPCSVRGFVWAGDWKRAGRG
jgi:hypothetical protein